MTQTPPDHKPEDQTPHHSEVKKASTVEKFFFLKQTFALLLLVLFIVGGLIGAASMVKEGDPDIEQAIADVTTIWAGADPETIENQITDKLEAELKSLRGLDNLSSASFEGRSLIIVEFKAEADVSDSIALVRAAVDEAKAELPDEAEQPTVSEISAQDVPILTLGLYGNIDQAVLSRVAEDIQELLEKVPNVSEVNLGGQREEVVQVQLLPSRMMAMGVSSTQVANAIQNNNLDTPWDQIESDAIGYQLRYFGRYRRLDDLKAIPVARIGNTSPSANDGRVVRLDEVADVRLDLEREKSRAFLSTHQEPFKPVITVDVVKVPSSDTIQIIDNCLAAIEEAKTNPNIWVHGLEYEVINTDAETIQEDLNQVTSNVLQGVIAVSIVLLLALTWREALIAGLSIPLTFLAALALLFLLGYTLNTMVQVGMILALGLLVDVFILMMEGMHEGIFVERLSWPKAALKTVRTYATPALTGQLTTILALAPLMAISGTMGKFIRLIPITAITCLLMSYGIALLVDIPISYYLLGRQKGGNKKTFIDNLTETVAQKFYHWTYRNTARNRFRSVGWVSVALALFIASVMLISTLPGTLFPASDKRKLSVNIEFPPTTTLDSSQVVADDIGEILQGKPYFENVVKYVGQRSNLVAESGIKPQEGNYLVGFSAVLVPKNERDRNSFDYVEELRQELDQAVRKHPGALLVVNPEPTGPSGDPIELQIIGQNMQTLRQLSGQIQVALREISGTLDVRDDLGPVKPDIKIRPRREAIDFYGLSPNDIAQQGRFAMTDNDIGDFITGGGEEDKEIHLSTRWPSRGGEIGGPTTIEEIRMARFFTPEGETLTAQQILEQERGVAPLSITHQDGDRTVTVLAKNTGRTIEEIWADLEPELQKISWPTGYRYKLAGEAETQGETFASAGQMAIVAIFLVFAVLVIQFGSFTQPFIIMMMIPLALIGTFTGFFLLQIPVSFPAVIGIIALTGIVVNDAIVMVETMNNSLSEGKTVREAAAVGASARLRPILTTSITTIVGVIPLALSDPTWFPLASAIGFGLVASTLNALLIIPALYLLLTGQPKEVILDH